MQMCSECNKIYDESEYSRCPRCYKNYNEEKYYIVYDDEKEEAVTLSEDELEEFKKTHPGY